MRTVVAFAAALILSGIAVAQEKPATSPTTPSQATPPEGSVCKEGGIRPPRITLAPGPKFTKEEERDAKYKGVAILSLVVSPEGKPTDIKVTKSLGAGLDKKAIEAVNTWKFDPATKDCKPVAVKISVEVTFALQ